MTTPDLIIGNTWNLEIDDDGSFVRRATGFRNLISREHGAAHPPVAGRYHLYVSLACPWAHRTLIVRALKGLQDVISVDVVHPHLTDTGWSFDTDFPGATGDRVGGFGLLQHVYRQASPDYQGVITVPVLWDKQRKAIVNNESSEIIRMLTSEFNAFSPHPDLDLYPVGLRAAIDETNAWIYPNINNGVYRCGFARSQRAYECAVDELFRALDRAEAVLSANDHLCGQRLTEADIRLFTTLVRFDEVYHGHFKCNFRRLVDYPNLWAFTRDIFQLPGVASTVNMEHIKRHYYESPRTINPTGIVPVGPSPNFAEPHGREELSKRG